MITREIASPSPPRVQPPQPSSAMAADGPIASQIRVSLGVIIVGDALVLSTSVVLAGILRVSAPLGLAPAPSDLPLTPVAGPVIVFVWLVLLFMRGAYSVRAFGAGTDEYRAVIVASLASAGVVGMSCYLLAVELSRGFVFFAFIVGIPSLLAWRYAARIVVHRLRSRGRLMHRVIAVGGPVAVQEIVQILRRERGLGYDVIAACLPEEFLHAQQSLGVPVAGSVGETRRVSRALGADAVLVTRGAYQSSHELRSLAWELQGSNIELIVVPSLTDIAGPRIHMHPVAGLPLLHLQEPQVSEAGGLMKRLVDVLGSVAAIALLAPLMLVVALAIKWEDHGPVFFRQRRIGWNGDEFVCLKFRSMSMHADTKELALREADGHQGALWKSRSDPRVTRVGRVIRKFSLDELPQLFNVLSGKMSLVGPRPQQAWEVETYSDSARRRLLVRPGMTGLWQVSGRSDLSLDEAVRLDLYYVDNWSMTTDLVIVAKTAKAVFSSAGAY